MLTNQVVLLMLTGSLILDAVLGASGLVLAMGGFLYRRDDKQQTDIDENEKAINELDTSFAQLTTRLFGHPEDEDQGLVGEVSERGERVQEAETRIRSLQEEVRDVGDQAEANGEGIEHLEERVTEHARQTRTALKRIEDQLDEKLVPDDGDFLRGGD